MEQPTFGSGSGRELPSGMPPGQPVPQRDAAGPWRIVGNVLCDDRIAVRVEGGFDSDAERRRVLGKLCKQLNRGRRPG